MVDEKFNGQTKAEWEAEKEKQENLIAQYEKEKKEQYEIIENTAELYGQKHREAEEAKQEHEDIKGLVAGIIADTACIDALARPPLANDAYITHLANDRILTSFETNVGYEGLKYLSWVGGLNSICFQMAKVFQDINVDKLFEVIEDTSKTQFAHLQGTTGANKIKRDRLKKIFKIYSKDNIMFNFTEKGNGSSFWSKTIGHIKGKDDWEVILDDDNKPDEVVRFADIFYVMENLFPKTAPAPKDNILLNDSDCLKDSAGNSLLDKKYSFKYKASSNNESFWKEGNKAPKNVEVNNLIWGKGGGSNNEGICKFFWDIFGEYTGPGKPCEILENDDTGKEDYNLATEIPYRLRMESEWKVEQYKSVLNAIWRKKYVEAVKTYVEGQGKVFSDTLKKAAFEVAQASTKFASATESEIRKIKKDKAEIAAYYLMDIDDTSGQETALQKYKKNVKRDPGNYTGPGTTLVLTKFNVASFYRNSVNEAKRNWDLKEGVAKALGSPSDQAGAAYVAAEAKLFEAKKNLKTAESSLKHFEGMDLGELKKRFMELYGEGTKNGTVLGQYTPEQIFEMQGLLESIKKEEPNKQLDTTYLGYAKDLKENIDDKIAGSIRKINPLMNAFEKKSTFQEMVESLGIYKNSPDLIMVKMKEFKDELNDIKIYRKLGPAESFLFEQVEYYVNNNGKYKEGKKPDIPGPDQTKLDIKDLREALKSKADAKDTDLKLAEWDKVIKESGTKINSKDKIAELIKKTGKGDTSTEGVAKFGKWKDHLKTHAYGDGKVEKDDADEQWNEFIKKDPKVVIGAILYFSEYEYAGDTAQESLRKEINDAKTAELGDDKELTGDDENWKTDEQKYIIRYLYRRETGRKLFETKAKEEKKKKDDDKKPGDETKEPSWFKFRSDNIWRPMVTYGGGLILILAVVGAVFWKNITEWWNGPAEEEGEIGEDEKSSEDDN